MKTILTIIAALTLLSATTLADTQATVISTFNLQISLNANGALDGVPAWASTGPGALQVNADGMGALLVTAGAGTNTVTISATAGGNPLQTRLVVTIKNPAPPPATALGVTTSAVPK